MVVHAPDWNQYKREKCVIWVALVVIAVLMELYFHLILGISIVYTSFSYLLIAIGGLWYRKGVIYMGAALGTLHIVDGYLLTGIFEPAIVMRGLMYFVVAVIIWVISGMAEKEHFALIGYINETALRLKGPLHDISQNLEEIAEEITDEEIRAQILVQASHARQASETIRELNCDILSQTQDIPDAYRRYLSK